VKAIENLMKKKGKFDYILLETTGLADPGFYIFFLFIFLVYHNFVLNKTFLPHFSGPIASLFWLDTELCSDIFLDGIITLVDGKYGLKVLKQYF
jgi:G3E family GTPase